MAIPVKLINSTLLHLQNGVPLTDLQLTEPQRNRIARVEHVYWQWMKNPMLEPFQLFKQLAKGRGSDPANEWRQAKRDNALFDFVLEHVAQPNRRISEARVRAAGNRLIKMGMETDNGKDIEAGAKLIMKVDRLEQPESEQVDMSKLMFLPPVVVTDISKVDETKRNVDDAEMKRIMEKYGGFVDEKMKAVDEMVKVMETRAEALSEEQEETAILPT